jgi:formyl-CoA transferase
LTPPACGGPPSDDDGGARRSKARAAGAFVDVPQGDGGTAPGVATPVDFGDTRWAPGGPSPECGQHTEEILLELGFDWEAIGALKERGAIP